MNQLYLLVRVSLINQLKLYEFKDKKDKKKKLSTIMKAVLFVFLGIMIMGYAALTAIGLVSIGMARIIPLAAITAVSLMTVFFTIFKTNGILFGYKDYDMLTALPVKTTTLVASRFMQIYAVNAVLSLLIMLPMGVVYGISRYSAAFSTQAVIFYFIWILSLLFIPLIPTTIASIVGLIIMKLSSKMKYSNLVSVAFMFAFLIVFFIGSTLLSGKSEQIDAADISALLSMTENSLMKIYPVGGIFGRAVLENSVFIFILFAAGSYIWYRLFICLTAHYYKGIQSDLASYKTGGEALKDLHVSVNSQKKALLIKEWKRLFSSSAYLMNMGVGAIMLLVMAIAVLMFPNDKITEMLAEGNINIDINTLGVTIAPFIIGTIAGMSCAASCALSLEGSNIELLKALPVKAKDIYLSKIYMNLTLITPPTFLASIIACVRFAQSYSEAVLIILLSLIFNIFTAVMGMYINIKFPNFTWESEITIVKQSFASFLGIFSTMLLCLVTGFIVLSMPKGMQGASMLICGAAVLIITLYVYSLVSNSPIPEKN